MNEKDPCSSVFVMFQSLASIYRFVKIIFFVRAKKSQLQSLSHSPNIPVHLYSEGFHRGVFMHHS